MITIQNNQSIFDIGKVLFYKSPFFFPVNISLNQDNRKSILNNFTEIYATIFDNKSNIYDGFNIKCKR